MKLSILGAHVLPVGSSRHPPVVFPSSYFSAAKSASDVTRGSLRSEPHRFPKESHY